MQEKNDLSMEKLYYFNNRNLNFVIATSSEALLTFKSLKI